MANYYQFLATEANPFNWIQVVPLMSPEVQEKMGYDHAGRLETSLMMAAYPETVQMEYVNLHSPWYTREAGRASRDWGFKTIEMIVSYLVELVSENKNREKCSR